MSRLKDQSGEIRKLWSGFQSARVLLTANNYRVFDYMESQRSVRALAKDIGTDVRATEILLDALTGLGLLRKGKAGYRNSGIASRLLVSGRPYYQGDILRHVDVLWDNWSGLDKVMVSGAPYHKSRNHRAFILGMHNLAILKAREVIGAIGLSGVRKALDLGGGPGTYALEMAKKGVEVTLFDRPETIRIARRFIGSHNKKKIGFLQGDFLSDGIGRGYDLILISQIFHAYSETENVRVLKKCGRALNTGGKVAVLEFFIEENRVHPVQSAMFSVNMLVNTEGGRCYSAGEIKDWLSRTGLRNVKQKFIADNVLISARK